ncbi:hypothetical protein HOY82DRAFT_615595 [Tuber indicum]|nr:hypothetical protein HOY82DRAFT_615595 [Tuber indicum]
MAARVSRIPPYPTPRLYSPSTSFYSRFLVNRFPASRLRFSHFQSSGPGNKKQGSQQGLSTLWSQELPHSSQHIRRIFVKLLELQKQLSRKIKAHLPQTNLGRGLATIFAGSVVNIICAQYSDQVREKRLQSVLAMGAVPDVEDTEELVEHPGATHPVNIGSNNVSDKAFAQEFAKAFRWTPATHFWLDMLLSNWGINADKAGDDREILVQVFKEFHRQAKIFKKNVGYSTMLVLDNVNCLAQKNPELLDILQDIAKDAADDRLFTTVFVTSEGQASIQMMGKF